MAKRKARTGDNTRKPSRAIDPKDVPIIKKRIGDGEFLNRIAADFDVNPGRISEIKNGWRHADIPASK